MLAKVVGTDAVGYEDLLIEIEKTMEVLDPKKTVDFSKIIQTPVFAATKFTNL